MQGSVSIGMLKNSQNNIVTEEKLAFMLELSWGFIQTEEDKSTNSGQRMALYKITIKR